VIFDRFHDKLSGSREPLWIRNLLPFVEELYADYLRNPQAVPAELA